MRPADLMPPALRAALPGLRLASRRPARGGGLGQHASRARGEGLEFAQYRAYVPGDDPRRVDWTLYARSDRWFVREAERDSPLSLWLLVDASASMGQADAARPGMAAPGMTRLDAAKALAAACLALGERQGDRIGLALVADGRLALHPPALGPRHRERALHALASLRPGGGWPDEAGLRTLWARIRPGEGVLLLSDHFDDAGVDLLVRLAGAGREASSVQILTAEERDFPFAGGHRFVDPESGAAVVADGAAARDGFLAAFRAARAGLAARLAAAGVAHATLWLDGPLDAPLRQLFAPTARAGGAR